jgi:ABC-2 type transport system permease protein
MSTSPRFADVLIVEAHKLRRSLALHFALIAPTLVAVFVFFNLLRQDTAAPWQMSMQASAGIWAFFMLPMSVTALTALVAHTEHGPRAWEVLYALPRPRWQWPAAKALMVLGVVALMSAVLALSTLAAIDAATWWKPAIAPTGARDLAGYLGLLVRIGLSATLLVAVQLWVALRYASFVPALAVGIGGTFFAVVATSAKVGVLMPWQIPVNQLASNPDRALLALTIGVVGGGLALLAMCGDLARREMH